MTESIHRLRAVLLAALYVLLGIAILWLFIAGRRPWTGFGAFLLMTWSFQVPIARRRWSDLGITPNVRALIGWALGAMAGSLLFLFVAAALAITRSVTFRSAHPGPGLRELIVVLAVAAMIEEALFRGFPLSILADGWGKTPAVIVSTTLFATLHMTNPGASPAAFAGTWLAGWSLAWIFLATRSLWTVWGAHLAWNAVQGVVLGFPISGLSSEATGGAGPLRVLVRGSAWWTGGDFGPEASVPGLIVLGALACVVAHWAAGRTAYAEAEPAAFDLSPRPGT